VRAGVRVEKASGFRIQKRKLGPRPVDVAVALALAMAVDSATQPRVPEPSRAAVAIF
jgi:hypothetical protein